VEKYINTVETNFDTEVVCYIADKKTVGSIEECLAWVWESQKIFPDAKYHTYRLEEVT